MLDQFHTPASIVVKTTGDVISLAAVVAALTQYLPPIAALLTIVWTIMRIYESRLRIKRLKRGENVENDG